MSNFESYQSPFSWRYGSVEMRSLWGEVNKRRIWRRLWVALAQAQVEFDLVTPAQVEELKAHAADIDMEQALAVEARNHHDLMAELKVYASQCPSAGGVLHLGATSMDIKDNAEVLQIAQSLDLILLRLRKLLQVTAEKIDQTAALPVMAFTHLQPAEPTTLGYRLAGFGQDLLADYETLSALRKDLQGKGFKGAVGNAASYEMLYGAEGAARLEENLSKLLDLPFFEVATQTYPRKQDYTLLAGLSGLGATAYKFAFDLRLLQSETIGELAEPFGADQVGSSAMPFKRNPVDAEKIDSLARVLATAPVTAWNNYAHSLLERTLDDSANRRTLFPETFLALDEILLTLTRILQGLQVKEAAIERTLAQFGPFSAIERVLMAAVKAGADRQELHEVLRQLSLTAWTSVQQGQPNPLQSLAAADERVTRWVSESALEALFDVTGYTGSAERRARAMAEKIKTIQ
ncbi:MAG: adenylosuccinate lyase [Anaerolineaceae bacterium]|nr:adenylosuccinate lyase [Anaerolineaceae bacterium]